MQFEDVEVMWEPTKKSGQMMRRFWKQINRKYDVKIDSYWDLHRWSVENTGRFWEEIWNISDIVHSKPFEEVLAPNAKIVDRPEWFRGARLNYAENLLRFRDDHVALIITGEEREDVQKITYNELYAEACQYTFAFRKLGVVKGDRVAGYISNKKEAILAMLAATAIGAIWCGSLPFLGAKATISRFKQMKPKLLLTVDKFQHDGKEIDMLSKVKEITRDIPEIEKVVIVPSSASSLQRDISSIRNSCFLENFLTSEKPEDGVIPDIEFEQLPFNHPIYISFTSGTTGQPKCLGHSIGVMLAVFRDLWLQEDATREKIWLGLSPVGWATWTMMASTLFMGCSLALFEGQPFNLKEKTFYDIVNTLEITGMLVNPRMLDSLEKRNCVPNSNNLATLETFHAMGSIVKPQNFDFFYKEVKADAHFSSCYGCTELLTYAITFDKTLPIYRGEMCCPCLGMDVCCYNDEGESVFGEVGEMVIRNPNPALLLFIWGDDDGSIHKEKYCTKYPDVFTIGDLCLVNPVTRGIIHYGRSDATLKPGGARFGSVEIYNIVEGFKEVWGSLCVAQFNRQKDERTVLFIQMASEQKLTKEFEQRIRETIEKELSNRHVPEVILEVAEIPYNLNGKKMELLVKSIINKSPFNADDVRNPDSLQYYYNIPQLEGYY